MHVAVKRGNIEVINELIRIKYPLNEPKVNGITALGISAIHGKLQIMKKLVENGADVNLTSPAGISPLYLAIKARNIECIRYLFEKGAKSYLNDPIWVDFSPVFLAVTTCMVSVLEIMCDLKEDLDSYKDSQGYTPFTLAIKHAIHDVVNYLSLRGVNLDQEDPEGKTVL